MKQDSFSDHQVLLTSRNLLLFRALVASLTFSHAVLFSREFTFTKSCGFFAVLAVSLVLDTFTSLTANRRYFNLVFGKRLSLKVDSVALMQFSFQNYSELNVCQP